MQKSKFSKDLPVSRRVFAKLSTAGLLTMAYPLNRVYAQTGQKGPKRFFCMYQPGGFWQRGWSTANADGSINFSKSHAALEPYADQIVAIKGLNNTAARNTRAHKLGQPTMLTGSNTNPSNPDAGSSARSVDQFIADKVSGSVPFTSLEAGFRNNRAIVYAAPNTPLKAINGGQAIFDKLFKGQTPGASMGGGNPAGADPEQIAREMRVLDGIMGQIALMKKELVGDDKLTLEKHLDSIRDLEKRIELSAGNGSSSEGCYIPNTAGSLDNGPKEAELILDLVAQAFICGLTNVATYATRKSATDMIYDWMPEHTEAYGTKTHHSITHTESFGTPQANALHTRVDKHYVDLTARMLKTLSETPEPDGSGSMLDNTLIMYSCDISKPDCHCHKNMNWMIMGGKGLNQWKTNRFVDVKGEKLHNIHVTFMRQFGYDVNKFGNSTAAGGAADGPCSALA